MAEKLMQIYDSMTAVEKKELYDFAMFIITKRQTQKTASQSHIDKFFGSIDDTEAASMMSAVEECRRIEPNEW